MPSPDHTDKVALTEKQDRRPQPRNHRVQQSKELPWGLLQAIQKKRSQSQRYPGSPDVRRQDMGTLMVSAPCSQVVSLRLAPVMGTCGPQWQKASPKPHDEPQIRECQTVEGNQPLKVALDSTKRRASQGIKDNIKIGAIGNLFNSSLIEYLSLQQKKDNIKKEENWKGHLAGSVRR